MAVHEAEANVIVKMPALNTGMNERKQRKRRRRSEVSISEPDPEENPPPVVTCPVCDTVIPQKSLDQRWVDDPIDNVSGYVCSEACADLVADRVDHAPELPDVGFQWVRRA